MEGWVDLGGWLHTEMVVTHRSINRARRTVTSLIGSDALPLHHAYRQVAILSAVYVEILQLPAPPTFLTYDATDRTQESLVIILVLNNKVAKNGYFNPFMPSVPQNGTFTLLVIRRQMIK